MNSKVKKIFIILGIALIIILVIIFFFILPSQKEKTLPTTINTPTLPTQPAPTIIHNVINQGQADLNFSNTLNSMREPYPWYNSLPLQTKDYFVYFDIPQKKFLGSIYSTSNNLGPASVGVIKKEAAQKLQGLGVDTQLYPVVWREGL